MKNYIFTSMWRKPIFRSCMSIVVLSFVIAIFTGCQTGVDNDIEITPQLIEALKKYDRCFDFHDGLAAVIKDGKYGYINGKGNEVIPVQYEFHDISDSSEGYEELTIRNFSDGLVAVAKFTIDDELGIPIPKWGFMDKKGNIIIPFQYANVGDFSEGICAVDEGAYIDKEGNLIFKKDNSLTNDFHNGLALIKNWEDYSYIFVDKKGNDVIDCSFYSRVEDFHDGLAYVEKSDDEGNITYKGFIDTKGKEVINCSEYENVNSFNDGLASVCKNEKWGFINQKGLLVIPCEYNGEYDWGSGESTFKNYFSEGLCQVDSFFIDKNNDVVLRISDGHSFSNFSNGLSCGTLYGGDLVLYGYMDKNGNRTFSEDDYKTINQSKKEAEERYKRRKQEEEERRRREEQERIANLGPEWLQGTWICEMNTPYGLVAEYKMTIQGNQMSVLQNGKTMYQGVYKYENCKIVIDNGESYSVDEDRQRVSLGRGYYYKRISRTMSSSSIGSNIQFYSHADVMSYLSKSTFVNGNTRVKIDFNGMRINGTIVSGSPQVVQMTPQKAVIKVSVIPSGDMYITILPNSGELIDGKGDVFKRI